MTRRREVVLVVVGLVALAVGALLVSPRAPAPGPGAPTRAFPASSFDAGPRGAKALYLLLGALGEHVGRRTSAGTLVADERVRVVLGPAAPPDVATLAWVGRGNTLILAPPPLGTRPGVRPHGSGRVVALPSAAALENDALRRDPQPAVAVAALCAAYAYGGRVVFDETPRGAASLLAVAGRFPLWPALLQALVALVLLVWARAPRFGPVAPAAPAAAPPPHREQVDAIADLYERAAAASVAAGALAAHFRQAAGNALGLPTTAADVPLAAAFTRRYGGDPARLERLLAAAADPHLAPGELARVARELYDHEQRMERSHGT